MLARNREYQSNDHLDATLVWSQIYQQQKKPVLPRQMFEVWSAGKSKLSANISRVPELVINAISAFMAAVSCLLVLEANLLVEVEGDGSIMNCCITAFIFCFKLCSLASSADWWSYGHRDILIIRNVTELWWAVIFESSNALSTSPSDFNAHNPSPCQWSGYYNDNDMVWVYLTWNVLKMCHSNGQCFTILVF